MTDRAASDSVHEPVPGESAAPRAPGAGAPAVRDVMHAPVVTIGRDENLWSAMDAMIAARVHHLAVVAGGRAVGIIADRDLASVWAMDPLGLRHRSAHEAMTEVEADALIGPELDVVAAAERMIRRGADAFVVVGPDDAPVGVVTEHDLLSALVALHDGGAPDRHPGHSMLTPD